MGKFFKSDTQRNQMKIDQLFIKLITVSFNLYVEKINQLFFKLITISLI